jgi:hypothetical protein
VGMAVATLVVNSFSSISFQDVTVWALFALLAMAAIAEDVFRRPNGLSDAPPRDARPSPLRGTWPRRRWPRAAHGSPGP